MHDSGLRIERATGAGFSSARSGDWFSFFAANCAHHVQVAVSQAAGGEDGLQLQQQQEGKEEEEFPPLASPLLSPRPGSRQQQQ